MIISFLLFNSIKSILINGDEVIADLNINMQATHFFLYKGKKYPFNMQLFKCFSQYFKINSKLYKNVMEINILDDSNEEIILTESTIKDFINFCQSKKIILTIENAPSLYKLAKKYSVPTLIDSTKKYLTKTLKEFLNYYLEMKKYGYFNNSEYKEMLSNDLSDFIDNGYVSYRPKDNDHDNEYDAKIDTSVKKIDQIEQKKRKIQKKLRYNFDSDDSQGLISHFNKTVIISNNSSSLNGLLNIKDRNNGDAYFNYKNGYTCDSLGPNIILFDFGLGKKIDLFSYLIRTDTINRYSEYYCGNSFPFTWTIEGSNDKMNWTTLDRREEEVVLDGVGNEQLFDCQNNYNLHGNDDYMFRYIRYTQEKSIEYSQRYIPDGSIDLDYFELYGDFYLD